MNKHHPTRNTILTFLLFSLSFTQTINVQGTVINENNKPIGGVNIFSGAIGTSTLDDGSFLFLVNKSSIITFTHIGYLTATYSPSDIPNEIILTKNILKSNQIIVSGFDNIKLSESHNTVDIITSNEIKHGRENHFKDLISKIPNLTFASGTSNPRYFLIRGIGELSQFSTEGNPNFSIGYIIDNVDFSGIGSIGATFGIDQVEVFKGPQNYIFGPNAMAGVINIKSLNPTPYLSAKAIIGANTDQGYNLGLSISNALTTKLAYRFTGYTNYSNGFIYNKFLEKNNTNKNDESFLRSKLIWETSQNSTLKLMGFSSIQDNGYDAWSPDNNGDTTYTDYTGMDELETNSYSAEYEYRFPNSSIQYISTYSDIELSYNYDGDWGNNTMWESNPYNWDPSVEGYDWSFNDLTNRNRTTRTTDVKFTKDFSSLIFTMGIFRKELEEKDDRTGFLLGAKAESVKTAFDISHASLYSNLTYKLSDDMIFNIGSRYSNYRNSYTGTGITSDENWLPIAIEPIDESIDNNLLGYHLSLKYQLTKNSNIYTTINRGYKAGGINQNPYLDDSQRFFKPEYNLNINGGFGHYTNGYEAKINLFYMSRSQQQVGLYYQLDASNPLSFTFYTANANEGYNSGIETTVKVNINNNSSIVFNSGVLKNYVGKFNDPFDPSIGYGDREPAHSPKFNYSLVFNYKFQNGFHFSIENSGMDEFFFDDQAFIKSNSYMVNNINFGYNLMNWHFSAWGKNILNEKYATRGYYFDLGIGDQGSQSYKTFGSPSHFGISLEYNF